MSEVSVFLLKFDDFDIDKLIENHSLDFYCEKTNKKQNFFSNFIRYLVFSKFYGLDNIGFADMNGKPYLLCQSLEFNISHTANCVVIAVADNCIGVDIESSLKKRAFERIAKNYFTTTEYVSLAFDDDISQDFYKLWTLKEADVKRSGLGIAYGLRGSSFYKNNIGKWLNNSNPNDFSTFIFNDMIISICCDKLIDRKINFYKISNQLEFIPISK